MAKAGAITIDEAGVNAIFSQESFGDTPVSIRFDAPQTIVAPQFLVLHTIEDLQKLYSLVPNVAPTVVVFFVDTIWACDTVDLSSDGRYFGCANKPGNYQVLNSTKAAEFGPCRLPLSARQNPRRCCSLAAVSERYSRSGKRSCQGPGPSQGRILKGALTPGSPIQMGSD